MPDTKNASAKPELDAAPGSSSEAPMGQINVQVNGRSYRLACGAGDEQRAEYLANHVRKTVDTLINEHGHAGDDRLLLMAAMYIADELFDARDQLAYAEQKADAELAGEPPRRESDDEPPASS